MKILILGCGSIGQRHIENLHNISNNNLIEVFDKDQSKLKNLKIKNIKIAKEESVDINTYDCVIICTPPNTHVSLAIRALEANSNVFIEKPLSNNLEKLNDLIKIKNEKNLLVFVGYSFRFNKQFVIITVINFYYSIRSNSFIFFNICLNYNFII